jgi:hypothetical protein
MHRNKRQASVSLVDRLVGASIIDAKLWALRRCEHRSPLPVCTTCGVVPAAEFGRLVGDDDADRQRGEHRLLGPLTRRYFVCWRSVSSLITSQAATVNP